MTATDRERLRAAIDRRVRELLAADTRPVCPGCGGDRAASTTGCAQCWERGRNRRRRADPAYRAAERIRNNQRRAARKAGR